MIERVQIPKHLFQHAGLIRAEIIAVRILCVELLSAVSPDCEIFRVRFPVKRIPASLSMVCIFAGHGISEAQHRMPESLKLFRHGIIADASLTSAQPRPVADIPSVEPEVMVAGDDHAEAVGMNPRVVGEIPADAECPLKVFINGEKSSAVYSALRHFSAEKQVFSV